MSLNLLGRYLLIIVGAILSIGFVVLGLEVVGTSELPTSIFIFGLLNIVFGVSGIASIFLAYLWQHVIAPKIIKISGVIYSIAFIVGSLDLGMISGLEWLGIIVVIGFAVVIWLAVMNAMKIKNVA